jgi:formylglycine-generating enzyme required for sulfatase activity
LVILCWAALMIAAFGLHGARATEQWDESPEAGLAQRIALVIGNGAYSDAPLRNPPNDAQLMARILRGLGFVVMERTDLGQADMKRAILDFGRRLEKAGSDAVGLFFYAGHGLQLKGTNYLVPIDATIRREGDVEVLAVDAGWVLAQMEYARNPLNIVILDACRNNPYSRGFRDAGGGLARMEAPSGTLIAYATRPGMVSADGTGDNSPYTGVLARVMQTPGLSLNDVFIQTRVAVMAATNDEQVPWEEGGLTGKFYFNAETPARPEPAPVGTAEVEAQPAPRLAPKSPDPRSGFDERLLELTFWETINESTDPADFESYLKSYPTGAYAELARNRLSRLGGAQVAALAPATTDFDIIEMDAPYVVTKIANLREGPSTDYAKVGRLEAGTEIDVTGKVEDANWYRIARAGAAPAFIYGGLITDATPAPAPPPASPTNPEIVLWESIKDSGNAALFAEYLRQFPTGLFAGLARVLLDQLRAETEREVAIAVPPPVTAPRAPPASRVGARFQDCPDCPEMVVIPAGAFLMGSPDSEEGRWDDEGPVHGVTIGRDFAVGRYEVTRGEFAAFARATGHEESGCRIIEDGEWVLDEARSWLSPGFDQTDREPAVCLNWDDAQDYVAWLRLITGKPYRLLSEAEWEYAARAGTTTARHWGEEIGDDQANCEGCGGLSDGRETTPVGSFAANGFGLYDMLGNVWEWVADCWHGDFANAPGNGIVWAGGDCASRVLRGGSWSSSPRVLRAALRTEFGAENRDYSDGLRVALSLEGEPEREVAAVVPPAVTTAPAPDAYESFRDCPDCPEMVVVPDGSFMMGSPESELERNDDEGPRQRVSIGAPFAAGRFAVTRDQFDAFVRATGHAIGSTCWTWRDAELEEVSGLTYHDPGFSQSGDHPVVCVSWDDAKAYTDWLGDLTGRAYRLLTEAEREYATRAGTQTPFSFGRTITPEQANYDGNYGYDDGPTGDYLDGTAAVGSYPANAFGFHDLHGNVWEWVEDCWHGNYEGAPADGAAWTGDGDCVSRVLRGGSWYYTPAVLRSAYRFYLGPGDRRVDTGFRVAATLDW